jgi:3-hydroxyacyl-CoA dehydrogenase/enoyl-CoA hydratase/3-hydroxybutyryl-CoA epimerase
VLLSGARLSGNDALDGGLVDEVVVAGSEVAAAEAWLLSPAAVALQPWDRPDAALVSQEDVARRIVVAREHVLGETLGHEPAPLAILDCIESGLPLPFDQAIRTEMEIFAHLIQRAEARDMIRVLFHGKADYERARRKESVPPVVAQAIIDLLAHIEIAKAKAPLALAGAGFRKTGFTAGHVQTAVTDGYWLDDDASDPRRLQTREALQPLVTAARDIGSRLGDVERRMIDYAVVTQGGFPAYLGGPIAFAYSRSPA